MLRHLTVFCDLDGVLANFDKLFFETYGKLFRDFEDEEAWRLLKQIPDFWLRLELMPDAKDLWEHFKAIGAPIVLLSSPGSHDEQRARFQKRLWVDQHLGVGVPLILAKAKDKCLFAARDRVLVDDHGLNIEQWSTAGGHGILHTSAQATILSLEAVSLECEYLKELSKQQVSA